MPMIQEWKLQMMAKYIFTNFISHTDEVVDLAAAMLEKHIADKDDNEEEQKRLLEAKQAEYNKLKKRLRGLMEMRAENEITREEYEEIRKDTDDRIEVLEKEIAELRESNEEDEESTAIDYAKTINYLKSCLAELVEVKDDEDLADDVIRAFVRKIVVFPDHFEWYLRLSPDDTPESICIDGKRKNSTKISSFGLSQHRLQSTTSNFRFTPIN